MAMTLEAHRAKMRAFAQHPSICALAEEPRWTVSTSDKVPIDIHHLRTWGQVRGCDIDLPGATATLSEVMALIPDATCYTFYLDSDIDGVCVLDIEPECDEDSKRLFRECGFSYGEVSMSGRGLHLLVPPPDDLLAQYPVAATKAVLKDKPGGWELLREHWVTFTGTQIEPPASPSGYDYLYSRLEPLCAAATDILARSFDFSGDRPDIPSADQVLSIIAHASNMPPSITPEKYGGDASRYEFAVSSYFLRKLRDTQTVMRSIGQDADWDDEQLTWLLYEILLDVLPPRDKHETARDGLPYLLWHARQTVAKSDANARKEP